MMCLSLLMRKHHLKCSPVVDSLCCRISIKMASQPCDGTIANTVSVFTAMSYQIDFDIYNTVMSGGRTLKGFDQS